MACAVVQSVGAVGNNVSSVTTGAITTTTGNLIHVDSACYDGSANAMAVSDSASRTYSAAVAKYQSGFFAHIYAQSDYAKNITGGSNTFTLSLGGAGYPSIGVVEISGADTSAPLDLHESTFNESQTTTPSFTTSGTTAQAAEIAIACIMQDNNNATVSAEATGWTSQYDNWATNLTRAHSASKVLSATGTVTYNPTLSAVEPYALHITTYKASSGGSVASGTGSATGAATASGVTGALKTSTGSATGLASAAGVGRSTAASTGSATGAATASGVGSSAASGSSVGSALGAASASGIGASIWASTGSAIGLATASGIAPNIITSTGTALGIATALGLGSSTGGNPWTPVTPASGTWTPAVSASTIWTPSS